MGFWLADGKKKKKEEEKIMPSLMATSAQAHALRSDQFPRKEGWSLLCICACLFNFLRSSLIGSCELYLHIHFTVQNKRLLWFNLVCTFKRRIPCWLKQSQGAIKVTWVSVHPSSDCLSILVRPKFLRLWLFNAVQSGYLALAKTLDQPK